MSGACWLRVADYGRGSLILEEIAGREGGFPIALCTSHLAPCALQEPLRELVWLANPR